MRAIKTASLTPTTLSSESEKLWVYCGLDNCVTLEVLEAMEPQLDNITRATYEFEKALQGVVLEINMRGIKIDLAKRADVIDSYQKQLLAVEKNLNRILTEGIGTELNWRSPIQLIKLFYSIMGYTPLTKHGKITVDRDALEKLEQHYYAGPIVRHILTLRDIAKKIATLKSSVDPDGRMRTSINIAGTNTGRFSSSMSDFGSGANFQNITEELRRIFIADDGMKLAYIDLEQAESRAVGAIIWNLFHDGSYLDAAESGDLHTTVTKMTSPNINWTSDLALDKDLAEQPFYRQHSRRHMSKVLGHGSNYLGKPWTMNKHTKIDQKIIVEFQNQYFKAFPGIKLWHEWVKNRIEEDGYLVSLAGRRRWFFGRRTEEATIREAVAYDPQSSVADILNRGLLNVWRLGVCQVLTQVHDALLVQYPEQDEDKVLPQIIQAIRVPIELSYGRTLIIPSDAKVGWNWSVASPTNPDGMKKFKGHDDRARSPYQKMLDRVRGN